MVRRQALLLFIYIVYLVLLGNDWIYSGEIWAESSTDFYRNSKLNFFDALFIPHSGYLAFPQRIISFFLGIFDFDPGIVAHVYNWSGILLGALLVSVINLNYFRCLIKSDHIRWLLSLSILLLAGFSERQFINFTYLGAFFVLSYALLAFYLKNHNIFPKLSMFIPFIMASKPAVLALMPILFLSFFFAKNIKFKTTLFIGLIFGFLQFFVLLNSYLEGVFVPVSNYTILEKLVSAILYWLFYLEGSIFGKVAQHYVFSIDYARLIFYSFFSIIVFKNKNHIFFLFSESKHLLLLLFFSALSYSIFNSFAISDFWNLEIYNNFRSIDVNRYSLFLIGIFFFAISLIFDKASKKYKINSHIYFLLWITFSGWILYFVYKDISNNGNGKFPYTNVSYWQKANERGIINTTCIPVNPLGWVYGDECINLEPTVYQPNPYVFEDLQSIKWIKDNNSFHIDNLITGFGIVISNKERKDIEIHAYIRFEKNEELKLSQSIKKEDPNPALIYFWLPIPVKYKSIIDIEVGLPKGIDVAIFSKDGNQSSFVINAIKYD